MIKEKTDAGGKSIESMKRTDRAEVFLEKFSSVSLTWENVFRCTEYLDKTNKEVVDLLLVLRSEGIFISMKCQQNPEKRKKDKLNNWVNKSALNALKQVEGGIKTSLTRDYWCEHPRRGKVFFKPNEIQIVHAIVIVETLDIVKLSSKVPFEVKGVPVSYLSVNDFLNIINEVRTIKDIQRYLNKRRTLPEELQSRLGLEKTIFGYYILKNGSFSSVRDFPHLVKDVEDNQRLINELIRNKHNKDENAHIIEKVSDSLSKRLESYEEGIDKTISKGYDSPLDRKNYILMQNELCDLILDERRQMGSCFFEVMGNVKDNSDHQSTCYKSISLDSKPDFQYVLSASKGIERKTIIKRSEILIKAALAEYNKKRGMVISYNQDIDNFEISLITKYKKTKLDIEYGKQHFAKLRMIDVAVEDV